MSDLAFICRFERPRDLRLSRSELSLSLTMIPDGISAEDYLLRATRNTLKVGYRLLGRASGTEPIFEHRATVGRQLAVGEIEVHLWMPAPPFATEPLRLLYVNCLLEGYYWFHDRGHAGTFIPLCLADVIC